VSLLAEAAHEQPPELRLVLDHEYTHAEIVAPGYEDRVRDRLTGLSSPPAPLRLVLTENETRRVALSLSERPVSRRRFGGAAGNGRLTALVGTVLLVLLAVEGATIPNLHRLLSVHVFVGMLLLGPLALKLVTAGYRFARYYTGGFEYLREGPPAPLMRVLVAPVLVLSTLTLFGSGVALLAVPHRGPILGLHKASFVIWFGATSIHVLAYALRAGRRVLHDAVGDRLGGRSLRLGLALLALAVGVVLAVATLPLAHPWLHPR